MSNGVSGGYDEPTWMPQTTNDKEEVRAQLERILADPYFLNSKRYPGFLRYVVNRTLEGHADQLRERTLGMEVFGREPDYDTGLDNVVRSTAGEIRRRLAQYYQNPAHTSEMRFDLPAGSYVPHFQAPQNQAAQKPVATVDRRNLYLVWICALAILCLAALSSWWLLRGTATRSDQFWKPVLDAPGSVLLCVGSISRMEAGIQEPGVNGTSAAVPASPRARPIRDFPVSSATALARFVGYLQAKGKPFQIREDANTNFADLRDGPVILIGAFINQWTIRLTANLRFSFRRDTDRKLRVIFDRQSQPPREWANSEDPLAVTEEYALISRFFDPTAGRTVVVAAGLHRHGTVAAGEFLTNPAALAELYRFAPQALEARNLQVILAAEVIGNNSGKARILATHFW